MEARRLAGGAHGSLSRKKAVDVGEEHGLKICLRGKAPTTK